MNSLELNYQDFANNDEELLTKFNICKLIEKAGIN